MPGCRQNGFAVLTANQSVDDQWSGTAIVDCPNDCPAALDGHDWKAAAELGLETRSTVDDEKRTGHQCSPGRCCKGLSIVVVFLPVTTIAISSFMPIRQPAALAPPPPAMQAQPASRAPQTLKSLAPPSPPLPLPPLPSSPPQPQLPPPPPPLVPPLPSAPSPPSPPPRTAAAVVARLNEQFWRGAPSNELSRAGVLIRHFDGISASGAPWLPCEANGKWCSSIRDRWPASIINTNVRFLYQMTVSGFLMSTDTTSLFCAYPGASEPSKHVCLAQRHAQSARSTHAGSKHRRASHSVHRAP